MGLAGKAVGKNELSMASYVWAIRDWLMYRSAEVRTRNNSIILHSLVAIATFCVTAILATVDVTQKHDAVSSCSS